MSSYGEAPKGEALKAQFKAKKFGKYEFELYPELWEITEIDEYYDGKEWNKTKFIERPDPSPPSESGIYMFVVAPHCGKLLDHSYIFYVGQAVNLNVRYSQYLKEKDCLCDNPREKVVNFLQSLAGFCFFLLDPCSGIRAG